MDAIDDSLGGPASDVLDCNGFIDIAIPPPPAPRVAPILLQETVSLAASLTCSIWVLQVGVGEEI